MQKPALGELSQVAAWPQEEEYSGITHFKESGDVYPNDADGWSVDRGRAGGLGDQRDQG